MKKRLIILSLLLFINIGLFSKDTAIVNTTEMSSNDNEERIANLSQKFHISEAAIRFAIKGYEKLKQLGQINNSAYLTIVDFSKPSNTERFYVIDMIKEQLIIKTLVAHGKNSGTLIPREFSNKIASLKSSLGFYVTGGTYLGKHGTSLILDGVEKGINDQAKNRAIVLHGANYVNNDIVRDGHTPIGRSFGCPAVPNNQVKTIIATIKGGSCLFVYAPNSEYTQKSHLAK
jgi:hypothetical protein